MAGFFLVNGTEVEMTTFRRVRHEGRVMSFARAFSGAGRAHGLPTGKQVWEGQTRPMTPTEIAALETLVGGVRAVANVTGAAVDRPAGPNLSCYVALDVEEFYPESDTAHQRQVGVLVAEM